MKDEDKKIIEELATMMGWRGLSWRSPGEELLLFGNLPLHEETVLFGVFPPSRNDGNGMLWLLGENHKNDDVDVRAMPWDGDHFAAIGTDMTAEPDIKDVAYIAALSVAEIPMAVFKATLAVLKVTL